MAYDEWDSQFQDVFNDVPGADYLSSEETSYAEALFEVGFTMTSDQYEAMGISEDEVTSVRNEFFDFMGIDREDFDWEEWREAMGYE